MTLGENIADIGGLKIAYSVNFYIHIFEKDVFQSVIIGTVNRRIIYSTFQIIL